MNRDVSIGEGTTVKAGFIVALLSVFFTGSVSVVWWAATLSTEVRGVREMLTQVIAQREALSSDVGDLKAWRKLMEQVGSPKVQKLEEQVAEGFKAIDVRLRGLEDAVRMHVITTTPKGQQGATDIYTDPLGGGKKY